MTDLTASTIEVAAPRASVMDVIADFAAYPDWAQGIRSAQPQDPGPDGRPGKVAFSLDAGVLKDSYVLAYHWDGDQSVRWELAEAGSMVSEMSGSYTLGGGSGPTSVRYELAVGTKVPLPGLIRRRAEKTIIDTALRGLKKRAESRPAAG